LGKNWACFQLSRKAGGEYFLFTDADTRHSPPALSGAVSTMLGSDLDLLTAFPRHVTVTAAEKLTIPILGFSMLSFFPLLLAYRLKVRSLTAAIGQFMMFRRRAYLETGGHGAIREKVLDDFELAKRIKAAGFSWRFMSAGESVSCRMYSNAQEVFRGLGKNLFSVFGRHVAIFAFIWIWMVVAFIEPLVLLPLSAAAVIDSAALGAVATANIALALALWLLVVLRFRYPLYLAIAYPVIVFIAVLMAFYSMYATIRGKTVWKGRTLAGKDFHWI
jgi:chlorobactene glucosyltransferase